MSEPNHIFDLLVYQQQSEVTVCFSAGTKGLFISVDDGKSWQYAYQSLFGDTPMPTLALEKAELSDGAWKLFAGIPGAVLYSGDDGGNWQVARLPEPEPLVTALVVSPEFSTDGTAFAATQEDGIFVTTSHGTSWIAWNFGLNDVSVFALAVSPAFKEDKQIFAGVSTGLFKSLNGGKSWHPVDLPCGYDPVLSLVLSPTFGEDGVGFAGTENHGLFVTWDGGVTWDSIGGIAEFGPVNQLAVKPNFADPPALMALIGSQLYISNDIGKEWQAWWPAEKDEMDLTAFTAPDGVGKGSRVWVGSSKGDVRTWIV